MYDESQTIYYVCRQKKKNSIYAGKSEMLPILNLPGFTFCTEF